jgi:putative endonuclease|tara:strand:- start:201 stop:485 length:285 start_codon:yes stop_codon:yes gene_type:complete
MSKLFKSWCVYIVRADDESLYTGITTNVYRRFQQHLNSKQGAKYFNGRKPEKIVYIEEGHDRSSASKREAEIKSFSREKKLLTISEAKSIEPFG